MTEQTLSEDLVVDAYRLFLGRAPNDPASLTDRTFSQLISGLFWSNEFHKSPRSKKNSLVWPEAQYFISRSNKVMYCPIGKVACSFLKRTMVMLSDHPHQEVLKRSLHMLTDHVKTGLQLSDYGQEDVEAFMADPEMFRFAVLRDPARRMLSAYVDKFVQHRMDVTTRQHHTGPVVGAVQAAEGLTELDHERGISFRSFVEHVVSQPAETLDPHWRPQSLYLADYGWKLYRLDQMDDLVKELEERTGMSLQAAPLNESGSGNGDLFEGADLLLPAELEGRPRYSAESFITPDLEEMILEYFSDDYDLIEKTYGDLNG